MIQWQWVTNQSGKLYTVEVYYDGINLDNCLQYSF